MIISKSLSSLVTYSRKLYASSMEYSNHQFGYFIMPCECGEEYTIVKDVLTLTKRLSSVYPNRKNLRCDERNFTFRFELLSL